MPAPSPGAGQAASSGQDPAGPLAHRRDLEELAGKEPTDRGGHRNTGSFLRVAVAGLAQLARCLDATCANPWAASKVDSFAEPSRGQRAARSR